MRFRQPWFAVAAAVVASATAATAAPKVAEYPDAVGAFERACLSGELSMEARESAAAAEGWAAHDNDELNISAFGISRAIEKNFDFSKPDVVRSFEKTINGQSAVLVLAGYPEKRRYQTLCALVMRDVDNAFTYSDSLKAAFKALGISGKSVDLPHYFEWAGKVGAGKNPVRGEIFTRSQVFGGYRDMHMYVAF